MDLPVTLHHLPQLDSCDESDLAFQRGMKRPVQALSACWRISEIS